MNLNVSTDSLFPLNSTGRKFPQILVLILVSSGNACCTGNQMISSAIWNK